MKRVKSNSAASECEKARQYSFLLLKFRQRSEKEIRQRLARKKFSSRVIAKTVGFLKDKKFIDDRAFARSWLQAPRNKSYGLIRLRHELWLKGIDGKIIKTQLNKISRDYSEIQKVEEIIQEKLAKTKDLDFLKAKRRIYAYLIRHGFSPDTVIDGVSMIPHPNNLTRSE